MQTLPIYLYQNILDIILDLDPSILGVNNKMYQRDLVFQKGLKNQIKIQFKNSDQKRIRIFSTQTFVFSMFDTINKRILIEKPLEVLDINTTSTKGLAMLTLSESETIDLDKSSYNFSVKCLNADGSYSPAYSNTYYGINGTAHIKQDIFPFEKPSILTATFLKVYNESIQLYEFKSDRIYASPEYNNLGIHTVALYFTGYKGTVYLQGSLDNNPTQDGSYFNIMSSNYDNFTGIDYKNFYGIFSYIRVIHVPKKGPAALDNDDTAYSGTFDKFLYRS